MTAVMTTNLHSSEATDLVVAPLAIHEPVRVIARGWHDDPLGLHDLRFHDGLEWTEHVTHFGPVPCLGGCHPHRAH